MSNEQCVDTKHLQLVSLNAFMHELAYQPCFFTSSFESFAYENRDKQIISFATAVNLYNNKYNDNHGNCCFSPPFHSVGAYRFIKAQAAKIVRNVFLTYNKKQKTIYCHKHWVKFEKPIYAEMFLPENE